MTISEQISNIDHLIESIERELPEVMEQKAANDLKVMISNRVIEKGETSTGAKFSSYSTNPIYVNTTDNSPKKLPPKGKTGRTVFAKTGKPHKSTYFEGGYKEFRSKIGRSTDKDFFLTGEMWRKFGVKRTEDNGAKVTVVMGGVTETAQKKIDANSDREGISIIEPNKIEINVVESILQNWINDLAKKAFNS